MSEDVDLLAASTPPQLVKSLVQTLARRARRQGEGYAVAKEIIDVVEIDLHGRLVHGTVQDKRHLVGSHGRVCA